MWRNGVWTVKKLTSCDMRPLRIVRPPPGRGVRGVLAPALVLTVLLLYAVSPHKWVNTTRNPQRVTTCNHDPVAPRRIVQHSLQRSLIHGAACRHTSASGCHCVATQFKRGFCFRLLACRYWMDSSPERLQYCYGEAAEVVQSLQAAHSH